MEITTPIWRDAHGHGRQDYCFETQHYHNVRKRILPWWKRFCDYVLLMPNTKPSLDYSRLAKMYEQECIDILGPGCTPLVTIKMSERTTPKTIAQAKEQGVIAIKVYPEGVTTNSEHTAVTRELLNEPPQWFLDVLATCQDVDLPVLWHGELPGSFSMRREADFLTVFDRLVKQFPKCRQVLEHITTEAAVNHIEWLAGEGFPVAATVTLHHLWMQNGLDHLVGNGLDPDAYCMPIAKYPEDHKALIRAVKHGRVMLGTDSAVHEQHDKYKRGGCAGCFTAPTPEMLLQTFEEFGLMKYLVPFTSARMTEFYRLPPTTREITFVREEWTVPGDYDGLVPFMGNSKLLWRLKDGNNPG